MSKRLSLQKVMKLRNDYFVYVYKKYIYNVFTELNRPKNEQMILGMVEHNQKPQILEQYIQTTLLSQPQIEVVKEWSHEIFGFIHIICFDRNQVFIYCEETNQVYHPYLINQQVKEYLRAIPFYMKIQGTIFSVYGKLYFDNAINIQSSYDSPLRSYEELYEHIYSIISQNREYLSKCMIYSQRSLETDKFSRIFLDYMGPLCPLSMTPEELEMTIRTAMMVWNSELVDDVDITPIENEDVIKFLKARRRKYFGNIDRIILDYQVEYDYDGFEIILTSSHV